MAACFCIPVISNFSLRLEPPAICIHKSGLPITFAPSSPNKFSKLSVVNSTKPLSFNGKPDGVKSLDPDPFNVYVSLIESGASFDIANILYLAGSGINVGSSCCFFNSKKVSSSTLFLSAEENDNQTLPSSGK